MRTFALLLLLLAAPLLAAAPAASGPVPADCDDLRASALAGDVDPVSLLLPTCSGIRPGAAIRSAGGSCTMAWIVRDAAGALYGTTAGHCANVGARISLTTPNVAVGTMVYSVDQPIGEDFGVFRIDIEDYAMVSGEMCAWGGATGVWEGGDAVGVVRHFGFGIGTGTLPFTRARSGVMELSTPEVFGFVGAVAPGDSGSPARLATGEALGVITDLGSPRTPGTGPLVPQDPTFLTQAALGTRLDHGLARAGAALGTTFELVTGTPANELTG